VIGLLERLGWSIGVVGACLAFMGLIPAFALCVSIAAAIAGIVSALRWRASQ